MLVKRTPGFCLFVCTSWAQANRDRLRAAGSSLEFKLHRLRFISLVQQGYESQTQALLYARNFEPFAHSHTKG